MNERTSRRPRRLEPEGLIEQELQDELMLFDPARSQAFCLNQTAAFVWKHADGRTCVEELAQKLSEHINEAASEDAVLYALGLLEKDGLMEVETVAGRVATRRELLRKLSLSAIPMITVLCVRPPRAHASSVVRPDTPPPPVQGPLAPAGGPQQHGNGGFWEWLAHLFS